MLCACLETRVNSDLLNGLILVVFSQFYTAATHAVVTQLEQLPVNHRGERNCQNIFRGSIHDPILLIRPTIYHDVTRSTSFTLNGG
jgi:hypothetical protein